MPRENKNKTPRLPRGCRGIHSRSKSGTLLSEDIWHDLDVPLITKNNTTTSIDPTNESLFWLQHQSMLHRLNETGYSVVALSHTVFGKMDLQRDSASNRFPSPLAFPPTNPIDKSVPRLRILKRLNVILEQVSDLTYYSLPLSTSSPSIDSKAASSSTATMTTTTTNPSSNPYHEFLREYDIIAMFPRNDTVFSTICSTAQLLWVDILTLDYTAGRGGVQLPFTLKASNLSLAIPHGLYFEIPYCPAIMDSSKRKALVQTTKQFQSAILAKTSSSSDFPLILSSGSRRRTANTKVEDVGSMAFRLPGDLQNFCQLVLGFQGPVARKLMKENAQRIVERGKGWKIKWNQCSNTRTHMTLQLSISNEEEKDCGENHAKVSTQIEEPLQKRPRMSTTVELDKDEEEDLKDGFLRLS